MCAVFLPLRALLRVARMKQDEQEENETMLDATIRAVETVCAMDPSIDLARLRDALRVMSGEIGVSGVLELDDRVVKRREAARMLGVSPQMISVYGRTGKLRRIHMGEAGERASGYSLKSIKEALAK